jgi:hypothetical protein
VSDLVYTPSGISVFFEAEPKRRYEVNGKEVPSVTTILDVLERGGLKWWGMKVGVEGVLELIEQQEAYGSRAPIGLMVPMENQPSFEKATAKRVVELLKKHSLTVNDVRDKAGTRGTGVHNALEAWASTEDLPEPEKAPDDEKGFVTGLVRFLTDAQPRSLASEVMVGSVEHGYAGRFDLMMELTEPRDIVARHYPIKKDLVKRAPAGIYRVDLKTSAAEKPKVYEQAHLQIEAYEHAAVECGYQDSDYRAILLLTPDGGYEFVRSRASFDHFLAVKSAYDALADLKTRKAA